MIPLASVVIPTHDRAGSLGRLLDALRAQDGTVPFEVVVVDDASSDGTAELLAGSAIGRGLDLRTIRFEVNRGPAAARNAGWRSSRAGVVCFTDDDCAPRPTWLTELVGALEREGVGLAQGRTIPAPSQASNRGPFSHTMSVPHEDGHYATCNMAYRREWLERLGGFDEAFRRPYGEDTDLAWRAIDTGATTAFVAEAVVEHDVRPSSFRDHIADVRRREGLVLAVRKHGGLRALLPYRGYVRPTHVPLAGLLAAATWWAAGPLSPVRLSGVVGATGWYAVVCRRWRPAPGQRRGWIGALPLAMVADLVEAVVLARASVRYGALVL